MSVSNQEYYLKLEKLKNVHLETMAKLESMYHNKLYLKGVQPITNMDVTQTYRATSENNSFHPLIMPKSFSEFDLTTVFHSNVSDVSDEELDLEEENGSEGESLTFRKELIENAWDEFSLEEYSHSTKTDSSKLQILAKNRKKKMTPKVTVPKPFQMTIRETKKKQQNIKSKSQIELENNLLKKQLEEEAECQKKFRANPVPAYVFVPLYHEMMQQNEDRRRSVKKRSREILLASQKPFQFIEREAQKKEMQSKDLSKLKKEANVFKAKPVPKFVYSSEIDERLKEEELYREIRMKVRSEELLLDSRFPNSRLGFKRANKHKQQNCLKENEEQKHKPKIIAKVPDFKTLHQNFQKRLQGQKNVKHITVGEPFNLRRSNIQSNKGKTLEDINVDDGKLKEMCWSYASPRCASQMRSLHAKSSPVGCEKCSSPRLTEATRQRLQAMRNLKEEKRKVEEEQKRDRENQKQRTRKLQRLITIRAEANDPHQSLAQIYKSKLKMFRKHEKQRMKEYLKERDDMEERLETRPLLLERATQKNAQIAAEKHYSDKLRELGLCTEFVSMKGQASLGKSLRYHCVGGSECLGAGRGSDNENEVEESEFHGEEEKSGLLSDQSCEEEEEAEFNYSHQNVPEFKNEGLEDGSVEIFSDDEV